MSNNKEKIAERVYHSICDDKQQKLAPFYYETIDQCKQCGKRSGLDCKGLCLWCAEKIN